VHPESHHVSVAQLRVRRSAQLTRPGLVEPDGRLPPAQLQHEINRFDAMGADLALPENRAYARFSRTLTRGDSGVEQALLALRGVAGIDRGFDRLAFVIAAAPDRRMCGIDPGAAAGPIAEASPRAGPSRMIRRTDMKTLPNQALEPTETSSCRGSISKGASRVPSCLRGSAHRSA
jgi:hypothetical protein